jgi:hypothetical protein
VLFEGTGTVTKFLIVPDHVKEPEEILRVMLDDWESESRRRRLSRIFLVSVAVCGTT